MAPSPTAQNVCRKPHQCSPARFLADPNSHVGQPDESAQASLGWRPVCRLVDRSDYVLAAENSHQTMKLPTAAATSSGLSSSARCPPPAMILVSALPLMARAMVAA